ncbi:MAG: DUF58 domain-containing protein [Armatimonadota bacterium]|nr:DUF58 domain-containing protein [Armatimonadota bacterium]
MLPARDREGDEAALALTARLLRQVRRLEIRARHLAEDLFAGSYRSVFKGSGIEFAEVRRYYRGDSVSNIDWNVTARMGYPHVKEHVDERQLTVLLAVDVSGSVEYGSLDRRKQDVAAEVAGLLAFSAIRNNDKVGLAMFSVEVEKYIPPERGRRQGLRLIREMLHYRPRGRGTNIAEALEFISRVLTRRAIIFLISDFHDEAYQRAMSVAARRHDLIAVRLIDPRERDIPPAGLVELIDSEAGSHVLLDASDAEYRRELQGVLQARRDEQAGEMRRRGVDLIDVPTDGTAVDPLVEFFELRRRRLR